MITCRRARPEDLALFKKVRLRALKDSPEAFASTYEGAMQRDEASWAAQLNSTIAGSLRNTQFAFEGESCVGMAAVYREQGAPGGDLIMMWVATECRGTSAASLLVRALLKWARELGFDTVSLKVTGSNVRATKFYEREGFSSTDEEVEIDAERGLFGVRMEVRSPPTLRGGSLSRGR
jgi:ribosomal protein S18 acetylase RimI-like enzyme